MHERDKNRYEKEHFPQKKGETNVLLANQVKDH